MRLMLAATALGLAAAGTASAAPQTRDPTVNPPTAQRCFLVDEVQRYHGNGPNALIVRTRTDRYYRIGFAAQCPNVLRPDANVTLVSRGVTNEVCRPVDLSVTVTASQFPLTCAVSSIQPLTAEDVRALPDRDRP